MTVFLSFYLGEVSPAAMVALWFSLYGLNLFKPFSTKESKSRALCGFLSLAGFLSFTNFLATLLKNSSFFLAT